MSNFEVGDRVVVVDDVIGRGYWTCRRGSIVLVTEGSLPVRVVFDGGGTARFNPDELELEGVYDALSKKPVEESSFADSKVDSSVDDFGDCPGLPECPGNGECPGCAPVPIKDDEISHPSHYADGWSNGAEVIDLTENLNFNRGNAVKYLARAGRKGGPEKELEDLQKALWYVRREVERLGGSVE